MEWLSANAATSVPGAALPLNAVMGAMQHFNYDFPTPPPAIGVVAVAAATGLVSAGQGGAGQGTSTNGQSNGQNNFGQNSGQGNGQGNTGLGSLTPAVGSSYAGQGSSGTGVASQGSALSGSGSSGGSATPGRATAGVGTPGATGMPLPAERLSTAGLVESNPLAAHYATSTPGQSAAGASRAGVGQLVGENVVRTVQQPAVGEVHGRFRQAVGSMGR